jgi:hypothetical protein
MKDQLISQITKTLDVHQQHSVLSDWEVGFCESLLDQLERNRTLSEKQLGFVKKIEEKSTPAAIETILDWAVVYKEKWRDDTLIVAEYYRNTGYYQELATRILEDPDFVPGPNKIKKMCENKYAQKVLATARTPAAFAVGTDVEFRRPALDHYTRHLADTPCLVIEILSEVFSPAKGAKRYNILPYGEGTLLTVEERHLKKCRYNQAKKAADKTTDNAANIPF